MALIETRQLCVDQRLADIAFDLEAGGLLGVIGPNGSGKSTLLKALAGLLPYRGRIVFAGEDLAALSPRRRAQAIGYLPQSCDSAWSLRVEDVVALGRLPWGDQDAQAIARAIDQAGVRGLLGRAVDRLSGGEQARVWLARVLAGQPRLLLADEPIASLDMRHQRAVMTVLRAQAQADRAVIVALHDLGLAARHCDRLCLLRQGRILAFGPPSTVLTEAYLGQAFDIAVHVDLDAEPPVILAR